MPDLVLGPLIRYLDDSSATVWVQTDEPCTVGVLGHTAPTFTVNDRHYAIVAIEGLDPGGTYPYGVELDGSSRWPEDAELSSAIRTYDPAVPTGILFGSCRAVAPHDPPWTLSRDRHPKGRGIDALQAYAVRMLQQPQAEWPKGMLLLGDQVYVDEGFPETRRFIRSRRDTSRPPGDEVADFEEYTHLYLESWRDPLVRWFLSNVSTAMIFDDHDVADDWNISRSWVEDMRAQPWWRDRIAGGLSTYWIYQHLGNLSPAELRHNDLLVALHEERDGGELLRSFALAADRHPDHARWSFARRFADAKLVVVDSRCARVFGDGRREIIDEAEWEWLDREISGDAEHLLIGTSLPFLLPIGMHDFESWSEAICEGAWGRAAARAGERLRRKIDLEDWAAFRSSFDRLCSMLSGVVAGNRGRPPRSIVIMSGDVHYSYLLEASIGGRGSTSVHQAVCSPLRNPVPRTLRNVFRFGASPAGAVVGRAFRASTRLEAPAIDWRLKGGPWFDNHIARLSWKGPSISFRIEASGGSGDDPRLVPVFEADLT